MKIKSLGTLALGGASVLGSVSSLSLVIPAGVGGFVTGVGYTLGNTTLQASKTVLTPLVGGMVLILGLSPDPGATLEAVARHLTTLESSGSPAPLLALALCTGLALFAEKHLAPGVSGWLRHLPVSGRSHSRSFLLALIVSQAPLLGGWLGLWLFGWINHINTSWLRLGSILLTGLAAALLAAPCERRLLRVCLAVPGALLTDPRSRGHARRAPVDGPGRRGTRGPPVALPSSGGGCIGHVRCDTSARGRGRLLHAHAVTRSGGGRRSAP